MQKFNLKKAKATVSRIFKRKLTAAFLLLLLAGSISYAAAQIYWSRTIVYNFNVVGIDAELYTPTVNGIVNKEVATSLYNNQVALCILAENFNTVWLNITYTSDAQGLAVTATGQYYNILQWHPGQFDWAMNPVGSPFPLNGYSEVDKTLMFWRLDQTGGALVITFNFDTELVTLPGSYSVNLLFEMGFV